jgi:hypothetical protein
MLASVMGGPGWFAFLTPREPSLPSFGDRCLRRVGVKPWWGTAKIALDNSSDPVRRAGPDCGSRLEPPCRFLQELCSPELVDRLAQGAQDVQFLRTERHETSSQGQRLKA